MSFFQIDPAAAKTFDDVADKALDMLKDAAGHLNEAVEKVAPKVWGLIARQVFIDGIECFVGSAIACVGIYFGVRIIRKGMASAKEISQDALAGYYCGGGFLLAISMVVALVCLVDGMDFTLNPNYWTMFRVVDLLKQLKP